MGRIRRGVTNFSPLSRFRHFSCFASTKIIEIIVAPYFLLFTLSSMPSGWITVFRNDAFGALEGPVEWNPLVFSLYPDLVTNFVWMDTDVFVSKIILKRKTFFNFWVREVKEVSEDLVLIKCNLMDTKSLTRGSFCNKKF